MDTNMNNIEKMWQEQATNQTAIEPEHLNPRETHSIVDAVRKNMRMEFYLFLFSPLLYMVPILMKNRSGLSNAILVVTFVVFFLVAIYYLSRFYQFYKSSGNMLFNTKENLTWFYYELRFNMELYRSFVYHGLSIGFFAGFIWGIIEPHISQHTVIDKLDLLLYGIFTVVMLVITVGFTQFWLNLFYGKHLKQVKQKLDELNVNVE
jgi:hypothetical protein